MIVFYLFEFISMCFKVCISSGGMSFPYVFFRTSTVLASLSPFGTIHRKASLKFCVPSLFTCLYQIRDQPKQQQQQVIQTGT